MKNGKSTSDATPANHLTVDRLALTVDDRRKQWEYEIPQPEGIKEKLKTRLKRSCLCSKTKLKQFIYGKLPILDWLIGYDFKNWFVPDLVAGVTVAVMQIPQGLGFALLAYIPPICGIYMAFYQMLIYAILATSRHNSMGPFAVITLMTGKVVKELATFPDEGVGGRALEGNRSAEALFDVTENVTDSVMTSVEEGMYTPIQIATVVCFMVGVWHMIFGILQLGSLSVFLSDMLVSGFTTAAAFHVLTSQLRDLLGLTIKGASGPFKIIYIYIEIFSSLPSVNILTLIIGQITIVVLIINNEVLKPIVARYSKIPIPIELILVATGTAASYFANLTETYEISIVGEIPTGFPPPATPPLEMMGKVLVDSLVIAIVSYTINFSLAKMFAAKHNHSVDATQELYATGVANIASSFFSCAPTGSALARALIQESVGGLTQMASLIACALLLFVLLFIGPIFQTLPKAVLASIIVVALKGMFLQVRDMVAMWKVSKIEAAIWLVSFFGTVLIDIDFGLVIGVVFSLLVLLTKNQRPASFALGRVPNTDIYLDLKLYPQAKEVGGMKLFKIIGPIHFANRDNLQRFIVKGTGLDPKELQHVANKQTDEHEDQKGIHILLLDCNGISYIDSSGGKFLAQLKKEYEKANIRLCLAGLTENVYEILDKSGSLKSFSCDDLFHSLHDAVVILLKSQSLILTNESSKKNGVSQNDEKPSVE